MGAGISKFTNNALVPMNINDHHWLYEDVRMPDKPEPSDFQSDILCECRCRSKHNKFARSVSIKNYTGKWMLFYDKSQINESWLLAKKLYRENKLDDVVSIKCSTNKSNSKSIHKNNGVIIFYCHNSSDQDAIMRIGKHILQAFNYQYKPVIYYKTDEQTLRDPKSKDYLYKLINEFYIDQCPDICNHELELQSILHKDV